MRAPGPLGGAIAAMLASAAAHAQTVAAPTAASASPAPYGSPVNDEQVWAHLVVDQLEARIARGDTGLRWQAQAWAGPDEWRIWLKSEGEATRHGVEDGQQEAYFSKPVSTYWDVQVGGRYDLDSRPGRAWAAIGVEGLAPRFFNVDATAYAGQKGLAGKLEVSYDQLITNRLVLQPKAELNLYGQNDPARLVGAGVSDLDAGLRLRYEITRKFAPYVGVTWEQGFGRTADLMRRAGRGAGAVRFTVGLATWM